MTAGHEGGHWAWRWRKSTLSRGVGGRGVPGRRVVCWKLAQTGKVRARMARGRAPAMRAPQEAHSVVRIPKSH